MKNLKCDYNGDQREERPVIFGSDARVQEDAMVVEVGDTFVAKVAMLGCTLHFFFIITVLTDKPVSVKRRDICRLFSNRIHYFCIYYTGESDGEEHKVDHYQGYLLSSRRGNGEEEATGNKC
mmetsp:Transcript_11252/g.15697  ORF Transcript_11252/g.15697 Transcript_11252/m.15697 type:complete len:122 (+) Transcript_11252:721-1086(+)